MQNKTLNTGAQIPQVGLGLWKIKDKEQFNEAFTAAIDAGYRHFDTAQVYDNEAYLGEAWRASGVAREELFITTKIAVTHFGEKHTKTSFSDSLKHLQTDYVDLLLLHFPVTLLRRNSWKALEDIYHAGQAKAIGVSNYTIKHLEELKTYASVMPAVNQVELHIFLQQPELVDYCRQNGIVVEAYSPLAHGKRMDDAEVQAIADRHGKTYAQIMLRWCVENGLVVLPKSVTPERIRENMDVYSFELYLDDLQTLTALDRDLRTCWDPTHIP